MCVSVSMSLKCFYTSLFSIGVCMCVCTSVCVYVLYMCVCAHAHVCVGVSVLSYIGAFLLCHRQQSNIVQLELINNKATLFI